MHDYISFAAVFVVNSHGELLDYSIPNHLSKKIFPGVWVRVSLRGRSSLALVWEMKRQSAFRALPIIDVEPITPLPKDLLETLAWIDEHMLCSRSALIRLIPAITSLKRENNRQLTHTPRAKGKAPRSIEKALQEGLEDRFLLFGEDRERVYLRAVELTCQLGRQTLFLVPEKRLVDSWCSTLGGAPWHHSLSKVDKRKTWTGVADGEIEVVVGTRSALFLPFANLQLIVVEQEQDISFKQSQQLPYYHARDIAEVRGKACRGVVILGSGTPSLESLAAVETKKLKMIELAPLPSKCTLVETNKRLGLISPYAIDKTKEKIAAGERVLFFLNRRGYHLRQICQECGASARCPNCRQSLIEHRSAKKLICHFCSYSCSLERYCQQCGGKAIHYRGYGTEKLVATLEKLFPEAKVIRVDKGNKQIEIPREWDILVATQLVQSWTIEKLSLAIWLDIDRHLQFGEYRASEFVFQLFYQIARQVQEVILQTSLVDHWLLKHMQRVDYLSFAKEELAMREMVALPPARHIVCGIFSSTSLPVLEGVMNLIYRQLRIKLGDEGVYPPIPCAHLKLRGRYRWQISLTGRDLKTLLDAVRSLPPCRVDARWDVNPLGITF